MATLGQAVTVFEEDTLVLRFTFNDLTVDFDSAWGAWIGFCANTDFLNGGSSTIQRSKATTGWSYAGGNTPTETGQVAVIQNSNVIEVYFSQDDFIATTTAGRLTGGTAYYFELVVADNKNQNRSVVAATGIFTVNESLFTVNGFRP